MSLRLAFMGTPEFAKVSLQALIDSDHDVICVYCQPARQVGRGRRMKAGPVQFLAENNGIPVCTPESLGSVEIDDAFGELRLDAAVVVAYGLILPKKMLDSPGLGCINAHASLLPRWRGAAPIERAILNGDQETGISIMRMEEGLDNGPILLQGKIEIGPNDDSGSIRTQLSGVAATLVLRALWLLEHGKSHERKQQASEATYANKVRVNETRLDWKKSGQELACLVRALSPRPGAWFDHNGVRIKVLQASVIPGNNTPGVVIDKGGTVACAGGALKLEILQRPGKVALCAVDFFRGYALPEGTFLS